MEIKGFGNKMTFVNINFAIFFVAVFILIAAFIIYNAKKFDSKKFVITEIAFPEQEIFAVKKNYLKLKIIAIIGIVVIILSSLCLVARPISLSGDNQSYSNNDIELCLDVSGSTLSYDKKIIEFYRNLLSSFSGQRLGLTIFNSTSRQVFPLTTDYKLAKSRLDEAYNAFKNINDRSSLDSLTEADLQQLALFTKGTSTNSAANSLIGDGLASCVFSFGKMGDNNYMESQDRDKTIIFATDNALAGNPIYTLEDAMALAKQNKIKLESIYLSSSDSLDVDNSDNMHALTNKYGGNFYSSQDSKMIDSIISEINSSTNFLNSDQIKNYIDDPEFFVLGLLFGLLLYLFATYKLNE
ncbi:MAG: VWA domain-containing protein [Bifidobacteriaceae bacterium]|nr:VWA domain-containing protein [Bifidobacteriaceae bacterium]